MRRYTAEFADSPESDRGHNVNVSAVALLSSMIPEFKNRAAEHSCFYANSALSMKAIKLQLCQFRPQLSRVLPLSETNT